MDKWLPVTNVIRQGLCQVRKLTLYIKDDRDTIPPDQLVGFWIRAVDGLVNALAEAIQLDINPDLKTLEIQFHGKLTSGFQLVRAWHRP
jgi:hypothetical protein